MRISLYKVEKLSKLKKIIIESEKDSKMAASIILPNLLSMNGKQRHLELCGPNSEYNIRGVFVISGRNRSIEMLVGTCDHILHINKRVVQKIMPVSLNDKRMQFVKLETCILKNI